MSLFDHIMVANCVWMRWIPTRSSVRWVTQSIWIIPGLNHLLLPTLSELLFSTGFYLFHCKFLSNEAQTQSHAAMWHFALSLSDLVLGSSPHTQAPLTCSPVPLQVSHQQVGEAGDFPRSWRAHRAELPPGRTALCKIREGTFPPARSSCHRGSSDSFILRSLAPVLKLINIQRCNYMLKAVIQAQRSFLWLHGELSAGCKTLWMWLCEGVCSWQGLSCKS